jgi:hypothetical protein
MSASEPSAVRSFLLLIKNTPELLPAAPPSAWRGIDERRKDEVHECLRCPSSARTAYVCDTTAGPRWLDLCWPCSSWMRAGLDEAEAEERAAIEAAAYQAALDGDDTALRNLYGM